MIDWVMVFMYCALGYAVFALWMQLFKMYGPKKILESTKMGIVKEIQSYVIPDGFSSKTEWAILLESGEVIEIDFCPIKVKNGHKIKVTYWDNWPRNLEVMGDK